MRRTVVVLPGWFSPDDDSPFRETLPTLEAMAEMGELARVAIVPPTETPEAIWLGMSPSEGQLRQGPLTVAALGADPPDRSTHFHLSLLGLIDGVAVQPPAVVPSEDLEEAMSVAKRLDTRSLTIVRGEHLDHGLVWEGVGDHEATPATAVVGHPIRASLPVGEGEASLRRFIDDSVNLLADLELNARRIDEGIPPLNLLWPWGPGMRTSVPNLVLRRGERAIVMSESMRLEGLSRLVGYRHAERSAFGRGVNVRLAAVADRASSADVPTLVVLERPLGGEEAAWFARQLDDRLLAPLRADAMRHHARLAILATGQTGGLAVGFETGNANANPWPFDERSLEERALPTFDAWTWIERALRPLGAVSAGRTV